MPTQLLSPKEIRERYGAVEWFQAPPPDHPVAGGLAAGSVTDDTEQTLLLAGRIGPGARLDQRAWADALLDWERGLRARGSHDLLGPSTSAALAAYASGVSVEQTGRRGTTNGAAMRVCPVGIAMPSGDLDALVDAVIDASMLTHHTSVAVAGAAAIAAAVSGSLDGLPLLDAVALGARAARLAANRAPWAAGAVVAKRIRWTTNRAGALGREGISGFLANVVGTSVATQESVPAALALAVAYGGDPWAMLCAAASLGGDTDTIGAMAGAVAGAAYGRSVLPDRACAFVAEVNGLDIDPVVDRLLEIRCG